MIFAVKDQHKHYAAKLAKGDIVLFPADV